MRRADVPTCQCRCGCESDELLPAASECGDCAVGHHTNNPDALVHIFRTLWGMPPDKGELPVCGAVLTDAYDFPGVERPTCRACDVVKADIEARP